jgi:hypothetical protein
VYKSKNQVDIGNRTCTSWFHRKRAAFENERQLLVMAEGIGMIELAGSWYVLGQDLEGKEVRAQGLEKAVNLLRANPSIYNELKAKLCSNPVAFYEFGLPKSEFIMDM